MRRSQRFRVGFVCGLALALFVCYGAASAKLGDGVDLGYGVGSSAPPSVVPSSSPVPSASPVVSEKPAASNPPVSSGPTASSASVTEKPTAAPSATPSIPEVLPLVAVALLAGVAAALALYKVFNYQIKVKSNECET